MPQPLIELGGAAAYPPMHMALANGFVPQTYLPLLRPFMDRYHTVSLPPRALWGEGLPSTPQPGDNWLSVADDLLAGMERYGLDDVIALGHSLGGVTTMLAALKQPERFQALILLDPTTLTREIWSAFDTALQSGQLEQNPMYSGAMRRRREFESVEEAFERFRSRSLFDGWPDETLRLYVEYGTVEREDGQRILTWPPEWEAYYFATGYSDVFGAYSELAQTGLPVLFISGGESDVVDEAAAQEIAERLPAATHHRIVGHGHLFPHTAAEETARLITQWLQTLAHDSS